jgi:N-acetyl-alpha-D-glucosaminyl L-malate synthase BshA
MNLAVLCFHALGGSGVVASELARELAARGHRVHFIGPALPGRLEPKPPGIELHRVPLELPAPVGGQAYALELAARLIDVTREERIELIHAHYAIPHAAAASLARATLGPSAPPLVLTLHGSDVPDAGAREGQVLLVRKLALEASALTVPSAALAAQARARLRLPDQRAIEIIPNFVDTERFRPGEGRAALAALFPGRTAQKVLCHASNFRPVKRPLDLVRIFARVRARRPALLVLAGDGPERARVAAEVQRLGLQEDVAFAGATSELAPLLRACDLFLLPSETESFGLAALEAMSSGLPVIGARVGGLPEVVGEGGLLFPVGDCDAMADAALRLLDDEPARAALGQAARARAVQLFQKGPVVARWEALYKQLS